MEDPMADATTAATAAADSNIENPLALAPSTRLPLCGTLKKLGGRGMDEWQEREFELTLEGKSCELTAASLACVGARLCMQYYNSAAPRRLTRVILVSALRHQGRG